MHRLDAAGWTGFFGGTSWWDSGGLGFPRRVQRRAAAFDLDSTNHDRGVCRNFCAKTVGSLIPKSPARTSPHDPRTIRFPAVVSIQQDHHDTLGDDIGGEKECLSRIRRL